MVEILTEEWRDVKGYEGYYQVSNLGRVKGLDRWITRNGRQRFQLGIILELQYTQKGYTIVRLHKDNVGKTIQVHILVAQAFLPPCPGEIGCKPGFYQLDHDNEIKNDNRPENLKWILFEDHLKKSLTSENFKKLNRKGSANSRSKLTERDVKNIRQDYRPASEIAKDYNICETIIHRIIANKLWRHVEYLNFNEQQIARKNNSKATGPKGEKCHSAKVTEDVVVKIRKDFRPYGEIAKEYGISNTAVKKIILNTTWKHIPYPNLETQKEFRSKNKGKPKSAKHSKIMDKDVVRIREDNRSYSEIAKDYGVTSSAIYAIKRRVSWKHVE